MEQLPVTHYGLHTSPEGVSYLHQGRGAANFIGLAAKTPFSVDPHKNLPCPHLINVAAPVPDRTHWEYFLKVADDQLIQELLPVPKDRHSLVPFVAEGNGDLSMILVTLSRMSSPIYRVVLPITQVTKRQVIEQLGITNVCPLILTGIEHQHQSLMVELATESRFLPRKLILVGDPHMVICSPMYRTITLLRDLDRLDLASLNWEIIGSQILRRYSRGEPITAPLTKTAT